MSIDLNKIVDGAADAWEELTSTQTSRTGHAAARVASALANDVDPEVLALQMTKNSQKNNPDSPVTFTASAPRPPFGLSPRAIGSSPVLVNE